MVESARRIEVDYGQDAPSIPLTMFSIATAGAGLDESKIGVCAPFMACEVDIPKSAIGEVTATCALFHSRRAARAITGTFDRHLKPAGVKATHFSLLALVAEAEGRTLSEIAAYLAMDRTALARELRALEEVGLVRIDSPSSDRRTRLMTLTKRGKALVIKALPLWRKAQDAIEAAMTDHSWPHVLRGMQIAAELH